MTQIIVSRIAGAFEIAADIQIPFVCRERIDLATAAQPLVGQSGPNAIAEFGDLMEILHRAIGGRRKCATDIQIVSNHRQRVYHSTDRATRLRMPVLP